MMSIEVSDHGVSDDLVRESTSTADEDEEPLAYRITWHCKLGSRTLVSDTEREVNLKLSRYFYESLKGKRDRRLQGKLKDRRVVLDSCKVKVQTQARTPDASWTIDEPEQPEMMGSEWYPVDDQLEEWAEKYPGKELRVIIVWEYAINGNATADDDVPEPNNARIARRPGGSRSANMLGDLE